MFFPSFDGQGGSLFQGDRLALDGCLSFSFQDEKNVGIGINMFREFSARLSQSEGWL